MQPSLFTVHNDKKEPVSGLPLKAWLQEEFLIRKLNSPLGYLLLSAFAFLVSYQIGHNGLTSGFLLLGAVVLVPCYLMALLHIRFGIYAMLVCSFFIVVIKRFMPHQPIGLVVDVGIAILIFGIFIRQIRERDWKFLRNPVSVGVLIWLLYCLFEISNPLAPSITGWVFTVRAAAVHMLIFYVGLYVFTKVDYIRFMTWLWVILAMLGALYGLGQEFFGLRGFEWKWLMEDYYKFDEFYAWGRYRVFSFFSDPATFGILMGYTSLFSLVFLIEGRMVKWKKVLLAFGVIVMMWSMIYSGTRTAFAILPFGIGFYTLLSLRRKALITFGVSATLGIIVLLIPSDNVHLQRLKSTFNPLQTISFLERVQNQNNIQPYIQSHPIGGGLGSTGVLGRRFAPDTLLSQFPPDSGFVRIAVEMGWIGLLLYCGLLFSVFYVGVRGYFQNKHPRTRVYYLAFLSLVFAITISNYAQQAITQVPTSIIFYISMAILVKLKDADPEHVSR